jgi:hypothetical protein
MMDNKERLDEVLDELVTLLLPETGGHRTLSTIRTVLTPHLRKAVARHPALQKEDGRGKPFRTSATFYEMAGSKAGYVVAEAEPEELFKQAGVLKRISEWIAELHEGETISESGQLAAIKSKAGTLRTSLSRGNGKTSLRIYYTADSIDYLAVVLVERAEESGDD